MKSKLNTLIRLVVVVTSIVTLAACGEKDKEEDNSTPPGSCGFPEGGTDGEATVSTKTPTVLDELVSDAQNTMDFEFDSQIPFGSNGVVKYGPCGDVGVLLWTGSAPDIFRSFTDLTGGALETISPAVGRHDAVLFFDTDCTPVVVAVSSPPVFIEYTRTGADSWAQGSPMDDLDSLLGEAPSSVQIVDSDVGSDGMLYVFAHANLATGTVLVRGVRDPAPGSAWSFEEIPSPQATNLFAYRVGPDGTTHALYRNTEYPCDPCNVDFLHGTLPEGAGDWDQEIVLAGVWGDPTDQFIEAADMDFDSGENMLIAAHFTERVITGSYEHTELRLYGLVDGEWCGELVAGDNDGYQGDDGATFTGANPKIIIDEGDHAHVVFLDQAVWHDSQSYQNEIRGQVRYAVRSGSTWTTETLISQQGMTDSPDPLNGFSAPSLAVSADGVNVTAVGVQHVWETDSIYNDSYVPVTYSATAVGATVSLP